MKSSLRWTLPTSFVCLLLLGAWHTQDPELTTHAVAGTVHYLEGSGGNIGVCVGDDGVLVVDDKFANFAEPIEAAAAALSDEPIRFLLNTHWHGDHTGANAHFGEKGVPILSHENVRTRLAGKADGAPAALPVLTYAEGITLHLNGERIDVMHFGPGHTDGDSIVVFNESNVVHMGDLYFNGMFPFIDLDSGGDVKGYVEVVGAIAESLEEDVRIIPGHGPVSDLATLKKFHAMLVDTTGKVSAALAAGKSADDMVAEGVLQEYEEWGWRFVTLEVFTRTLAKSLSR